MSARVWYNTPAGITPPRTHVFLAVTVDGTRWLANCGLGGSTPTGLMELDCISGDQPLLGDTRRIVRINGRLVPTFMHQVLHGEAMPKSDQAMCNWWTSSHPESKFRNNLIVAVLNRDGTRYTLINKEFIHRLSSEILERIEISSREHLSDLLCERFGLELPKADALAFRYN